MAGPSAVDAYDDREYFTTYCTPDDVAMTLDLPNPTDPTEGYLIFTDNSHPSAKQVCRMIRANEAIIDRHASQSWRENRVVNQVRTINSYWHDINGWRTAYHSEGGNFIQLRRDVRPWDPEKGDKLELRTWNNSWRDVTDAVRMETDTVLDDVSTQSTPGGEVTRFWFDYAFGKLYIRSRLFQQRYNAIRITYRYGSEEPPPPEVSRLCCLLTAMQVINMQVFHIKVGMGGDIASVRETLLRAWQEEANILWSTIRRAGVVHSMLR